MPAPLVSLDKRIATALSESEHEIEDLAALIREVTDTIGSVEAEATHCMSRALDPSIVHEKAKGRADKATFTATRFNNALLKLQALYDKVAAAYRLEKCNKDLKELQVVRDEVATQIDSLNSRAHAAGTTRRFCEKYCEAAATIVGLFDQIAWVDKHGAPPKKPSACRNSIANRKRAARR
jgi:site-specific recombinase